LKIGNLSTQLGTQLESEIDETLGLSSRAMLCKSRNSNGGIKWVRTSDAGPSLITIQ